MAARAPDRRTSKRYTVSLPLQFIDGQALTRDVSESGVYFETDLALTLRSPIRFSLVLGDSDPDGRFVIECEGSVVRVEAREGKLGVAVQIASYRVARDPLVPSRALNVSQTS